jgi:hypothetical protein
VIETTRRWSDTRSLPGARSYPVQLLTALYWMAAAIHVEASAGHFSEWWLFGIFFAGLAAWQAAWGVLVYRDPSERALLIGAGVSLAVTVLWLVTRTVGIPIGPEQWCPEPAGALDIAATVDEQAIVLLSLGFVSTAWRTRVASPVVEWVLLAVLVASGVALMGGAHHVH